MSYSQADLPDIKLNDGTKVPILGYGLGTANYGKDSKDGIVLAYKNGYTHIDGAEVYGNEKSEADAIKELGLKRDQVFITSKVGSADPRASLEKSLKLLDTDYVDLYLIHSPEFVRKTGLGEAWKVMEQLQAEGKARSIGVSNYRIQDLEETLKVAKVTPSANQIELHPYVWDKAGPLVKFCQDKGIHIESYGPQSPLTKFPGGPIDPVVQKLAKKHDTTEGSILLKWAQQVTQGIIVTTSSKASRLQEMRQAFTGDLKLSESEIQEIIDVSKGHHKRQFMQHMDE